MMNELYTTEWRLYFNYFIPSVKLVDKYRNGPQIIKKYDSPKTPLQRILESEYIEQRTKARLQKQYESTNPFYLQKEMANKIKKIQRTVSQ